MIDINIVESIRMQVMEINSILAKDEITKEDMNTLEILKKSVISNIIDLLNKVNEL